MSCLPACACLPARTRSCAPQVETAGWFSLLLQQSGGVVWALGAYILEQPYFPALHNATFQSLATRLSQQQSTEVDVGGAAGALTP